MDIPEGSVVMLQPPSRHEIVSEEKQTVKSPPSHATSSPPSREKNNHVNNMARPGNWHKASWDPQFIYWELMKACCRLHNYEILDGIGLNNPQSGEVWTNPSADELLGLIIRAASHLAPDT